MRLFVVTILLFMSGATLARAEVAIIANKSVPIDSLSQHEVLDIYTGDIRRWKNGDPIIAHDLTEEGRVRQAFYDFLGRKSSRLKSVWVKNLLMGEGSPPAAVKSEAEVLSKVASTPGAVGFIRRDMVDDSVKILAIIPESSTSR